MKALIISDKKSERIRTISRMIYYFKTFQIVIYGEFNVMETVSTIASNCFFIGHVSTHAIIFYGFNVLVFRNDKII